MLRPGSPKTVDPVGGSYLIESLTNAMHDQARRYFRPN